MKQISKLTKTKSKTGQTKIPFLIVIFPYKFTDFKYEKLGLDKFRRYCNVQVWDISELMCPKYSKAISRKRSSRKDVIAVNSFLSFLKLVNKAAKESVDAKISVLTQIPNNSIKGILCNLILGTMLKKRRITAFDLYTAGVLCYPYNDEPAQNQNIKSGTFLSRITKNLSQKFAVSSIWQKMKKTYFRLVSRMIPSIITHRLVAGEDWLSLATGNRSENGRIKLIKGSSYDYSECLENSPGKAPAVTGGVKRAVLLDGAGPAFTSDAFILKNHRFKFTSDAWYPALSRLFDRLEAETGVKIEIAGHYKSKHPPISPLFGNRPVYYDKTREMVEASEFVITRGSTAMSYAIMYRKPIIFIYSNQLKCSEIVMKRMFGTAGFLGTEPVNIDDPNFEIKTLLNVNEERYLNYEKRCLTSLTDNKRQNYKIILEEIMDIPCSN
jgi:hypothetical protein